ncbi:MAG: peptidylprolyl isomerase [Nitrospira sp.]|nr:peptidylprolyl isomerase [Nitrospira sp.]MCP9463910.1 peptidylprolyl isomerase [Nitrospira sp.]
MPYYFPSKGCRCPRVVPFLLLLPMVILGDLVVQGCAAPPQEEEAVVALVNGRPITQKEFELRWKELSDATRARYEKEGGKRRFLDELVTRELLLQEARLRGLDQTDAIREKVRRYKEQLLIDELLKDKLLADVELSKEELEAYYRQHAHELLDPLKVHVWLMLLPNVYAAKDLENQINRGGNFAKFAQRYSLDEKTKANGGSLGPYRKGLVPPEVDAVIHTLKPGVVSAPIKAEEGYYLVMTTPLEREIIEADLATQERLRQELLAEKRRKRFEEVIADIRAKATIRVGQASRPLMHNTSEAP